MKTRALVIAALATLLLSSSASAAPFNTIRIAAYYPWFPEGWTYAEMNPFTHYRPSLGFYDAGSPNIVERQIRAMQYGRITAATYSWWGQGSPTDRRFDTHLAAGTHLRFKWAIYHELEGYGDPTVEEIRSDLEYIRDRYSASPAYLKLGGRPVVFVYGDADDGVGCDAATRWAQANATVGAYLVMRSFRGYRECVAAVDCMASVRGEQVRVRPLPVRICDLAGILLREERQADTKAEHRVVAPERLPHGELAGAVPVRDQLQRVGGGNGDRERRAVGEPLGLRPLPRRPAPDPVSLRIL